MDLLAGHLGFVAMVRSMLDTTDSLPSSRLRHLPPALMLLVVVVIAVLVVLRLWSMIAPVLAPLS